MANSRELELLISLKDEISGKLDGISKSLDNTSKSAKASGKAQESFAASARSAITGLAAAYAGSQIIGFLRDSVAAAGEAQQVQAQLGAVLNSTGYAAGVTAQGAMALAKELQNTTTFSDEAVLSAENLLLTFTNIKNDVFPQATRIVADMASALGTDLNSAAIQVGKALQDPILGVTALRRVGVNFNEAQTETIRKLVEGGDAAQAQQLIMAELNMEFGGSAQAQLNTYAGRVEQMKNKFNDLQEIVGTVVMPTLDTFFTGLIAGMDSSTESTNDLALAIGTNLALRISQLGTLLQHTPALIGDGLKKLAVDVVPFGSTIKNVAQSFGFLKDEGTSAMDDLKDDLKSVSAYYDSTLADMIKPPGSKGGKGGGIPGSGSGASAVKKDVESTKDALKSLAKEYENLDEGITESLFDLRDNHDKVMDDLREKSRQTVADLKNARKEFIASSHDLRAEFSGKSAGNKDELASAVLANQTRIADIQTELAAGVSRDRRTELEKELTERQKAETDNAVLITSIQTQIDEAKRVASLTDLQRAIEDYTQKQVLAQEDFDKRMGLVRAEYDEKKASLNRELAQIKANRNEETELYKSRRDLIVGIQAQVEATHQASLNTQLKMTKDAIQAEIEMYRKLAAAISAARTGNAAEVGRIKAKVNDAVINPSGDIISTHPDDYIIATKDPSSLAGGGPTIVIQGNTFIGPEDFAEKVGDDIVKRLGRSGRIG